MRKVSSLILIILITCVILIAGCTSSTDSPVVAVPTVSPMIVETVPTIDSTALAIVSGDISTPQPTPTSSESNIASLVLQTTPPVSLAQAIQEKEVTEANQIAQAIDYSNPTVKNFANTQVQHSSAGNYNIAQICDVWQSINRQWTYVSDPPNFDYWTSASDSINNGLKGNCADYAILNAAVIKSIGGDSRVITACPPNGGECHAYAEVALAKTQSDLQADANYVCSRYHCEKI